MNVAAMNTIEKMNEVVEKPSVVSASTETQTRLDSRKRKAVTPPSQGNRLTPVPSHLSNLNSNDLISLVQKLANERDDLNRQLKKARTEAPSSSATSTAATATATAAPVRKFDVKAMKKRIAQKSTALVKKAPHKRNNKPISELTECVPDEAAAMELFECTVPISNTARMIKWKFDNKETINSWLNKEEEYIYPCKYVDKVWSFSGSKPVCKAYCSYESCEAKLDKRNNTLTLKFKSSFESLNCHPSQRGW